VGPDQTDTVYIRKDEIIAILEVSSAAPDQARSNAMILLGRESPRQFPVIEKAAVIYEMLSWETASLWRVAQLALAE